jgi:hypothetical protein
VLDKGLVYRVETQPRSTEEYRIDIQYTTDQPVRLRIWTDPEEMSRWARMRERTANLPAAGFGVRAVYLGPFVRASTAVGVYPPPPQGTASATGIEGCLAVVPRGEWLSGPEGGCVLAVGRFTRSAGAGGMWLISTEPDYQVSAPGAALEQSVVLSAGIGTTVGPGAGSTDYLALGLGYNVATRALGRHVYVEAQVGITRMQELGAGLEPMGKASLVPDLGAGLQLRF